MSNFKPIQPDVWSPLANNLPKKTEDENSAFKNNIEIGERGISPTYFV